MSYLVLEHIRKEFGASVAVENFNLSAEQGEFISFLGPSGCGKTTTLRMIAGFEAPTRGKILLQGKDITNMPPAQRNVGMVFQSYALFPNMTVADNIGFGLKIAGKPKAEIKERVAEMLDLIHLPEFGNRYPQQLSGGQQQRIALARALAFQPKVLLLDEPLSALDAKIRVDLRTEIRRIQRQMNITTVYVTHDQEEALSLSDRIVVMNRAKVEQIGSPFEIYNYPKTDFAARFVGQLNLLPALVKSAKNGDFEVAGQPIHLNGDFQAQDGQNVKVAVRPEELSLNADLGDNHLLGILEDLNFLGSIVRLKVRIGESVVSADMFNEREFTPPALGSQVTIYFPSSAAWVLPAS